MDEIIYLEPDEEITSVIDKLKKSTTASVGLVIPRNASIIHSIVNLKLLQKEAIRLKKDIALVTGDKIGKNIASQVGLPVFEDVHAKRPTNPHSMPDRPKGDEVIEVDMSANEQAPAVTGDPKIKHYDAATKTESVQKVTHNEITFEPREDDPSEPEKAAAPQFSKSKVKARASEVDVSNDQERSMKNKGAWVFGVLFLVVVLATVLGLPQSTVLVTVAAEPFEKTLNIVVDSAVKEQDPEHGLLPGKLLETTKSDARRVVATGKKEAGGKAKGQVIISNGWDSNPIKFTEGTIVTATDGKTFTLSEDITVPGATATLSQGQLVATPGKGTASVVASEAGDSYNLKPTKFTISGISSEKQSKINGESLKDFSGGFTKQVAIMTQSDIDTAKDALVNDLTKEVAEELRKEAKGKKLIEEAITKEVASVETNPQAVDAETDYFDIKVKVKHEVMVFDEKQVNDAVDKLLKSQVAQDKELLLGEGDEFLVQVQETQYSDNKLLLESKVKTKIGSRLDSNEIKKGITGKNELAIREHLQAFPNVKAVTLAKFPSFWWQDTSFAPWNTRVRVVYE